MHVHMKVQLGDPSVGKMHMYMDGIKIVAEDLEILPLVQRCTLGVTDHH